MIAPRRLALALLGVVAAVLIAVIAVRLSAGADPAPQDTTPVVIPPSSAPSPGPSATPVPVPTDDDADDPDDDDD